MSKGSRAAGALIVCTLVGLAAFLGLRRGDDATPAARDAGRAEAAAHAERTCASDAQAEAADAATAAATAAAAAAKPHLALNGTVRAFDGRALPGAVIRAEPVPVFPGAPDDRTPVETTADAAGAFGLRGLAAGDWALLVSAEGALGTFVATVLVPERERFDLVLPRGSEIEGTVIDETTHAPVAGARVRLAGHRGWIGDARTSPDGRFRMALFASISARDPFRIDAPGWAREPAESSVVAIAEGVAGRHEVTLVAQREQQGNTLTGRVVGPDGPVTGARVVLSAMGSREDPEQRWEAWTDADGRYAIEHLNSAGGWLLVTAEGLVQEDEEDPETTTPESVYGLHLEGDWTKDVAMRRRTALRRCTITGCVTDDEGHPVRGARVRTSQGALSVATTSAADGSYVLSGVSAPQEPVSFRVLVEADGYFPNSDGCTVEPGETTVERDLGLQPMAHIRGRVTAPGGAPVAGARVVVAAFRVEARCGFGGRNEPPPGAASHTAADGTFDVAFQNDDCVAIGVEAQGFAVWTARYERSDRPESFDVTLTTLHALTGRVVPTGTDAGVAGLDVALVRSIAYHERDHRLDDDSLPRFETRVVATTAADGTFRVDDLPSDATLRVSGEGWIAADVDAERLAAPDVRIEVEPSLDLAGHAQFIDGRPCGGVAVTVHETDPDATVVVEPDTEWVGDPPKRAAIGASADGSFACGPLPRGRYWLEFAGGAPQVVRRVAGPFEAGTRDLRVELVLGRTIRGRVLRPDGGPAKSVVVKASPGERGGAVGAAQTDYAGTFAVGGLDEGAYAVTCEVDGCFRWTRSGVRANAEPLEIQLDEGLAVAGVVRDDQGEALSFFRLRVEAVDPEKPIEPRQGETDVSGRFRISALTPGRWRIVAGWEGGPKRLPETIVEAGSEALELKTLPPPPKPADVAPVPEEK